MCRHATNPMGVNRVNPNASEGWAETVAIIKTNAAALANINSGDFSPDSHYKAG
jgi:hypothetical protein